MGHDPGFVEQRVTFGAMPKRRSAPSRPRPPRPTSCLWLACFTFQRTKRDSQGSFRIVVEATGPEDAFERCYDRLAHLHETTELFADAMTVYTDGVIKLVGSFEEGLLVNWEMPMPNGRIAALTPEPGEHEAEPYTSDRLQEEPFIVFGADDETEPGPSVTN